MENYTLHQDTLAFIEPNPVPLYMNGKWITTDNQINVIDPATSQVIATAAIADQTLVNQAVSCAESAFQSWGKTTPEYRANLLNKLAELIDRDTQILAELESIDVGKPVSAATGFDVPFAADCFRYFAGIAQDTEYEVDLGLAVTDSATVKRPYGVAAFVFPVELSSHLMRLGHRSSTSRG